MTYARAEQLTSDEAGFYQAMLRRFPERGGPPDAGWQPAGAAVLTASIEETAGPKAESCCPVMNFFATAEAAEAFRAAHAEMSGGVGAGRQVNHRAAAD